MLPTRVSLLQQVKADRHDPAWNELLEYYTPFVNKILGRMGLKGSDLDEVRQLVLIRMWEGLDKYHRDEKQARFRNWLSTLIRNTALNWFKSQKRKQHSPLEENEPECVSPENSQVENFIQGEWERYIVELAMDRLQSVFSGKAFAVLALSLKGKSSEAIASELNLTQGSVYVLKNRVKTRLTQEIQTLRFELEGEHG